MDFMELVASTRTCRRFDESAEIEPGLLKQLVDCARLTPSAANLQPLRYITVQKNEHCSALFSSLKWAGYLKDWDGPVKGERPRGYIVLLTPTVENGPSGFTMVDFGIAVQTIQLAARSRHVGTCIFLSFDGEMIKKAITVPQGHSILGVVAIGVPVEQVQIVPLGADSSVKYYRDENATHFVPKRELKDILLGEF